MASKKRVEPDAVEDFKERQNYFHDPGKFTGGKLSPTNYILKRSPITLLALGAMGLVIVIVMLIVNGFESFDPWILAPALLSAVMVYGGIARLVRRRLRSSKGK